MGWSLRVSNFGRDMRASNICWAPCKTIWEASFLGTLLDLLLVVLHMFFDLLMKHGSKVICICQLLSCATLSQNLVTFVVPNNSNLNLCHVKEVSTRSSISFHLCMYQGKGSTSQDEIILAFAQGGTLCQNWRRLASNPSGEHRKRNPPDYITYSKDLSTKKWHCAWKGRRIRWSVNDVLIPYNPTDAITGKKR